MSKLAFQCELQLFRRMQVKMPEVQNTATGILVTAFSPDCRHFHLKHNKV